jgi:hypothetical protein
MRNSEKEAEGRKPNCLHIGNGTFDIVTYRPVAGQRNRNGRIQPLLCSRRINKTPVSKQRLGEHVLAETISSLSLGNLHDKDKWIAGGSVFCCVHPVVI